MRVSALCNSRGAVRGLTGAREAPEVFAPVGSGRAGSVPVRAVLFTKKISSCLEKSHSVYVACGIYGSAET